MKKINELVLVLLISGLLPQFLNAAQYARQTVNRTPFVQETQYNTPYPNTAAVNTVGKYTAKSINKQTINPLNNKQSQKQQNNSVTIIHQLPQPDLQPNTKTNSTKKSNIREVQFSGELFDMRILETDNDEIILPKRIPETTVGQNNSSNIIDADGIKPPLKLITQIKPNHVPSAGFLKYSEEYPDPRSIGTVPYVRGGIAPTPYSSDRIAAVPEEEVQHRHHVDKARKQAGQPPVTAAECPLCKDDPKTPCGECSKCRQGYPCERTVCRHCVQPVSRNLNNFCDLTAGDEPCGTCDSCREHRSDPCAHADDGRGPHGEWNPYKQSRIFAVIPRPILDEWNNGARKFPVYYNPAPYYRPYWNPSLYTGYARPYTFRYTCPVCSDGVCKCDKPPFAGQVPFAYTCKFCNRNPCACAADICDANAEMQPSRRQVAIDAARAKSTRIQDADARSKSKVDNTQDTNNDTNNQTIPNSINESDDEKSLLELFKEKPTTTPENNPTTSPRNSGKRQTLDAPKTQPTNIIPRTGVVN
ncbi:MAG: hypothetical protein LBC74_02970 [Planctomycetaceae bacterium]|jgi:hypothetical protein|nr:hypothetical protein [Planctomycetaceae bacterium]